MPRQTEHDKRVQAEVTRLQSIEAEKRFLNDRTVGGENVPRPTPEYIEKCVGPMKSETEIRREAEISVQKQLIAERLNEQRAKSVEQSMRQYQQRLEDQANMTKEQKVSALAAQFAKARQDRTQDEERQRNFRER